MQSKAHFTKYSENRLDIRVVPNAQSKPTVASPADRLGRQPIAVAIPDVRDPKHCPALFARYRRQLRSSHAARRN